MLFRSLRSAPVPGKTHSLFEIASYSSPLTEYQRIYANTSTYIHYKCIITPPLFQGKSFSPVIITNFPFFVLYIFTSQKPQKAKISVYFPCFSLFYKYPKFFCSQTFLPQRPPVPPNCHFSGSIVSIGRGGYYPPAQTNCVQFV